MLRKIKTIGVGAALATVGGLFTFLATEANYVEAFGPGAGLWIATAVGYAVRESRPVVERYIETLDD